MLKSSRARGQGHDDRKQRGQEAGRVGSGVAVFEDVVDQVALEHRRGELHGHRHQHQAAHARRTPAIGPEHLPQPGEDRLARDAARTGVAGGGQPLATLRAVGDGGRRVSVDVELAGRAQLLEIACDAVEAVGRRVRIAGQVDPVVVDVGLQEARADGALRAELGDFADRDVRRDGRSLFVAHGRHVLAGGDDPLSARLARKRQIGAGGKQYRDAIEPLAVQFIADGLRQILSKHGCRAIWARR